MQFFSPRSFHSEISLAIQALFRLVFFFPVLGKETDTLFLRHLKHGEIEENLHERERNCDILSVFSVLGKQFDGRSNFPRYFHT